jgi:hypothetical protein
LLLLGFLIVKRVHLYLDFFYTSMLPYSLHNHTLQSLDHPSFLFCIFCYYILHTFIPSHSSIVIRRGFPLSPHCRSAQWEKPHWRAEPRIELGPALQQADALPTELRRTLVSMAGKIKRDKINIWYLVHSPVSYCLQQASLKSVTGVSSA